VLNVLSRLIGFKKKSFVLYRNVTFSLAFLSFLILTNGCSDGRFDTAKSYIELKDYDSALRLLKEIEDEDPKSKDVHYLKLWTYIASDDQENAINTVNKLNTIDPSSKNGHYKKYVHYLLNAYYDVFDSLYMTKNDVSYYDIRYFYSKLSLMDYNYIHCRYDNLEENSGVKALYRDILYNLNPELYFQEFIHIDECPTMALFLKFINSTDFNEIFETQDSATAINNFIDRYEDISNRITKESCDEFTELYMIASKLAFYLRFRPQQFYRIYESVSDSNKVKALSMSAPYFVNRYDQIKSQLGISELEMKNLMDNILEHTLINKSNFYMQAGYDCDSLLGDNLDSLIDNTPVVLWDGMLKKYYNYCDHSLPTDALIKIYNKIKNSIKNERGYAITLSNLIETFCDNDITEMASHLRKEYDQTRWSDDFTASGFKAELAEAIFRLGNLKFLEQFIAEIYKLNGGSNYFDLNYIILNMDVRNIPNNKMFNYTLSKCKSYKFPPDYFVDMGWVEDILSALLISFCDSTNLEKLKDFYLNTNNENFKKDLIENIDLMEKPFMIDFYKSCSKYEYKNYSISKYNDSIRTDHLRSIIANADIDIEPLLEIFYDYANNKKEYNKNFDDISHDSLYLIVANMVMLNNYKNRQFNEKILSWIMNLSKYGIKNMLTSEDYEMNDAKSKYLTLLLLGYNLFEINDKPN